MLLIIQALGQLLGTLVVPSLELAMKFKQLHELDPDVNVNIVNLSGEAVTANQEVIARSKAWLAGIVAGKPAPKA